ncbi:MAG: class II aldolase/adducin family protein [Clostridiales bacterium]
MHNNQLISDLVSISSWAGADEDFVQAGGGNTSVKDKNKMLIKASGFKLSEINKHNGYVEVDIEKTIELINNQEEFNKYPPKERDKLIISEVQKTVVNDNGLRPSVESFLHALLGKIVIHTHPVLTNAICCVENCEKILDDLFFDDVLFVPYSTPGYPLACLMKEKVDEFFNKKNHLPQIVFLGNHGLFICGNSVDDAISRMNNVITTIEKFLKLDKSENKLKVIFKEDKSISLNNWYNLYRHYVKDSYLTLIKNESVSTIDLIKSPPLYPDYIVYCGKNYFSSKNLEITDETKLNFKKFIDENGNIPSIIYCDDGNIIFMGKSKQHVESIKSVFIAHAKTVLLGKRIGKLTPLKREEIEYIDNWESEKYRKNLLL